MKMRFCTLFFVLNIFSFFPGVNHAKELLVPVTGQLQGYWCWVAVSQAVLDYNGIHLEQCSIVEWTLNQNGSGDITDVCENPSAYNYSENPPGVEGILTNNGVPTTLPILRALSFDEIKNEINNNNPIIRLTAWDGGAHYTVVRGYDDTNEVVHIMDPGGAGSYYSRTYTDAVNEGSVEWTRSMTTNSSPRLLVAVKSVLDMPVLMLTSAPTISISSILIPLLMK
ncbi:MAG: hypothetical protein D3924_13475 [Candidatus Electrothrix sp. AR4]|nr:hypothetical protein [Candidatus Electrothrix sp. AR4]